MSRILGYWPRGWAVALPVLLIALGIFLRFATVPWNMNPLWALALLSGCLFRNRLLAVAVPFAAIFISDVAYFQLHSTIPFVYGSLLLNVILGAWILQRNRTVLNTVICTLAGSVLFFLITNFGFWLTYGQPVGMSLMQAYTDAIPFFRMTLAGDLLYAGVFFGGLGLAERYVPNFKWNLAYTTNNNAHN